MPYGEILQNAGKLAWKFKILWLFGLLASCTNGAGFRAPNLNFNAADWATPDGQLSGLAQLPAPLLHFLGGLSAAMRQSPWGFFAGLAGLVCGLALVTWLVGTFGRAGLAVGAWQGAAGAARLEAGALGRAAARVFWRVAGISLLVGLPGLAVALIFLAAAWGSAIAGLFAQAGPTAGLVLVCVGLPLLCLMLVLFWALGILSELATVAVAGEGLGLWAALKRSWALFKRHLGALLLMGLLVLVLQLITAGLAGLIFVPLGLGALLSALVFNQAAPPNLGLLLGLFVLLLPFSLALGAIFNTFTGALWVLTYRHLNAAERFGQPAGDVPLPPMASGF